MIDPFRKLQRKKTQNHYSTLKFDKNLPKSRNSRIKIKHKQFNSTFYSIDTKVAFDISFCFHNSIPALQNSFLSLPLLKHKHFKLHTVPAAKPPSGFALGLQSNESEATLQIRNTRKTLTIIIQTESDPHYAGRTKWLPQKGPATPL